MKARIPNQGPTGANMMKKLQEMQSNMESLQAELAVAELIKIRLYAEQHRAMSSRYRSVFLR